MKINPWSCLFLFAVLSANAQTLSTERQHDPIISEPVKWWAAIEKQNDSIFHLIVRAEKESTWQITSEQHVPKDGASPSTFIFTSSKEHKPTEKTKKQKEVVISGTVLQMDVELSKNKTIFVQPIKIVFHKNPTIKILDSTSCFHLETEQILRFLTRPSL